MPVTGFSHYNLRASPPVLEALRRFYVEVVGLREGFRPPFKSRGHWLYAGESEILHLSEAGAQETRTPHAVNTFDHVALKCTGLADMESTLKRHAVGFRRSEVPLTGQVQLFFTDPAGNGVELSFAPQDV